MGFVSAVLLASALGATPVEVSTLKGETRSGELAGLSSSSLTLKTAEGDAQVPVADLLEVRVTGGEEGAPDGANARVRLIDGSELTATGITTSGKEASLETTRAGALKVPTAAVRSVRLAPSDGQVEKTWKELQGKALKRDLLVIRKGDALDHLEGLVGAVDAENVNFTLGKETVPVKREKVFGIVYARGAAPGKPVAEVRLAGGDVLQVQSVTVDDEGVKAKLAAGPQVTVSGDALRALDFSLGKVRYLSQMEPEVAEYTPYFGQKVGDAYVGGDDFAYQRDRTYENRPLRLGGKAYTRGLWIHSRMKLQYRLGGEYRRFEALMGIDENLETRQGHVHVVISGDGKPLLEADVSGTDEPRPLDLDVSGVRFLEILVDYGENISVADHLDLADAKVIK